jgi:hypothetical protein
MMMSAGRLAQPTEPALVQLDDLPERYKRASTVLTACEIRIVAPYDQPVGLVGEPLLESLSCI